MPIAACLILRNSAATIEETLNAIRPFVDEINVFDTGSTDKTLEILRDMNGVGHQRIDTETGLLTDDRGTFIRDQAPEGWIPLAEIRIQEAGDDIPLSEDGLLGDFAWARQKSFDMASPEMDWFFWLDDDDTVVGAQHLRALAATAHPACDGYIAFYDYAQDEQGNNVCALWRERLLRRRDEFAWRNAVHEVWIPKEGISRAPNFITLPPQQVHYIHRRPADRYPPTRNLRILERVVAEAQAKGEEPDLRTLAYMGTELMAHGRLEEAIVWLDSYVRAPNCPVGDERSQVFHKMSHCLRSLGQIEAALNAEFAAIKERDDWAENAVGLCELFAGLGQADRAYHWGKRAVELGQPQSMLILNPIEFTFVPFVRLAEACVAMGKHEEGQEWLAKAAAVMPGHEIVQQNQQRFANAQLADTTVKALLTLREVLVRHDENLKAHAILENAPYIVAEDPRIVAARAMQREDVMHALKPEEYTRWYEDEPKESTVPDEWVPEAGEYIERAKFLLEQAQAFEEEHGRKPRMLDLGCNDAWMAGYLWLKGQFVCDGIELNKGSVEKAAGRVERFGIPGKVVQGNIFAANDLLADVGADEGKEWYKRGAYHCYDIVSCFEVYEHVPDTEKLLDVMESLLTPEGIACLTTPNGAFEQGNIAMWNIVERKGHLRAVPAHELAIQLAARGQISRFDVHAGGRLVYSSYSPAPKRGKVIFWGGPGWEQWSPMSINEGGLGGSETALSIVAMRLAMMGYDVRVYCDATPGLFGGGIWRPLGAFDPSEEADAIIVMRNPGIFDVDLHAPVRALWCHDHSYDGLMTKERVDRMTHVITLSDWERRRFMERYADIGVTREKSLMVRNGILYNDVEGNANYPHAERSFKKRKPRVIYSSSADRGLDVLLERWPQIRAQVPDAELHVFYGWDIFDRVAQMNPPLQQFKQTVLALVEKAGGEEGGVFMRGRQSQELLREEFQQARVWAYPTYFLETSCITAMEARAAGLACITSDLGALSETIGEHGILLKPAVDDKDHDRVDPRAYGRKFVAEIVKLLSDETHWKSWHNAAREEVEDLDWSHRVEEWDRLIQSGRANQSLVEADAALVESTA